MTSNYSLDIKKVYFYLHPGVNKGISWTGHIFGTFSLTVYLISDLMSQQIFCTTIWFGTYLETWSLSPVISNQDQVGTLSFLAGNQLYDF